VSPGREQRTEKGVARVSGKEKGEERKRKKGQKKGREKRKNEGRKIEKMNYLFFRNYDL
jgi:hypothetical protein